MAQIDKCELQTGSEYPIGPRLSVDLDSGLIAIPECRIRGRTGATSSIRGHFTATFNVMSPVGRLRVDHTGDLPFWLEIDLPELASLVEAHVTQTRGPLAVAHFCEAVAEQTQEPAQDPQ